MIKKGNPLNPVIRTALRNDRYDAWWVGDNHATDSHRLWYDDDAELPERLQKLTTSDGVTSEWSVDKGTRDFIGIAAKYGTHVTFAADGITTEGDDLVSARRRCNPPVVGTYPAKQFYETLRYLLHNKRSGKLTVSVSASRALHLHNSTRHAVIMPTAR